MLFRLAIWNLRSFIKNKAHYQTKKFGSSTGSVIFAQQKNDFVHSERDLFNSTCAWFKTKCPLLLNTQHCFVLTTFLFFELWLGINLMVNARTAAWILKFLDICMSRQARLFELLLIRYELMIVILKKNYRRNFHCWPDQCHPIHQVALYFEYFLRTTNRRISIRAIQLRSVPVVRMLC